MLLSHCSESIWLNVIHNENDNYLHLSRLAVVGICCILIAYISVIPHKLTDNDVVFKYNTGAVLLRGRGKLPPKPEPCPRQIWHETLGSSRRSPIGWEGTPLLIPYPLASVWEIARPPLSSGTAPVTTSYDTYIFKKWLVEISDRLGFVVCYSHHCACLLHVCVCAWCNV